MMDFPPLCSMFQLLGCILEQSQNGGVGAFYSFRRKFAYCFLFFLRLHLQAMSSHLSEEGVLLPINHNRNVIVMLAVRPFLKALAWSHYILDYAFCDQNCLHWCIISPVKYFSNFFNNPCSQIYPLKYTVFTLNTITGRLLIKYYNRAGQFSEKELSNNFLILVNQTFLWKNTSVIIIWENFLLLKKELFNWNWV